VVTMYCFSLHDVNYLLASLVSAETFSTSSDPLSQNTDMIFIVRENKDAKAQPEYSETVNNSLDGPQG
jgi:hypothetical protein